MTTPQQAPLFDVGNPLLRQGPARLDTGSITMPAGKIGLVTIRNASTTLTQFMGAEDLREWVVLLNDLADQLSGGIVVASASDIAAVSQWPPVTRS
jgi:hypothetical protein